MALAGPRSDAYAVQRCVLGPREAEGRARQAPRNLKARSGRASLRTVVLGLVPVVFAGLARPLLGPGGHLAGPEHDRVPAVDPDRERLDLVSIVEPPLDLQRVVHVDRREVLLGPPPRASTQRATSNHP